jgi:RNase P subunit RPR2
MTREQAEMLDAIMEHCTMQQCCHCDRPLVPATQNHTVRFAKDGRLLFACPDCDKANPQWGTA